MLTRRGGEQAASEHALEEHGGDIETDIGIGLVEPELSVRYHNIYVIMCVCACVCVCELYVLGISTYILRISISISISTYILRIHIFSM